MPERPPRNLPANVAPLSPGSGKTVYPIFVSKMSPQDKSEPDGFALIAAPSSGGARFHLEWLIKRDFPTLAGSSWTEPETISGIYRVGSAGVQFLALPKMAPFHIRGG